MVHAIRMPKPGQMTEECVLTSWRVREGGDATIVAWGPAVLDALRAADILATDHGRQAEVIDLRSLVPLDMETVLA